MEPEDQTSLTELFKRFKFITTYLKSKRRYIFLFTLLFAFAGITYSILIKPTFTATCTFVLEDGNKDGILGQFSNLAALTNLESGNNGIFKGDNIIELYKSGLMIKKTLTTVVNINGRNESLINRYITFNRLYDKWGEKIGRENLDFSHYKSGINRKQDSILNRLVISFNEKNLLVEKPDRKLSIIDVSFTDKDEVFAKEFTDKLVENVNNFYVQTKTKKAMENVNILQRQADSVKKALNSSISGVDIAIQSAPLLNSLLTSQRSASQKKQIDVQTGSAIYSTIIQNLEVSKVNLMQAKPLIQVIDEPEYPLKKNQTKPAVGFLAGTFLGLFFSITFFLVKQFYNKVQFLYLQT